MINPWILLGIALAIGGAFTTGGYLGYDYASGKCDTRIVEMVEEARIKREAEATAAFKRSEKLEIQNAESKIVYRTITKEVDRIVDRPVYRDGVCFDDDGVRVANDALVGKTAPPPKPDAAVSGSDSAIGRAWRDGIEKINGIGRAVP